MVSEHKMAYKRISTYTAFVDRTAVGVCCMTGCRCPDNGEVDKCTGEVWSVVVVLMARCCFVNTRARTTIKTKMRSLVWILRSQVTDIWR